MSAGLASGSLGLIAEALHSGTDLVAALLTLFAVSVAVRPPDREHPFGGNARPRRNRGLGNADSPRQRCHATCCLDCLFQTGITHRAIDFSPAQNAAS